VVYTTKSTPAATAVATPVTGSIVNTLVVNVLHVPPGTTSVKVAVEPIPQINEGPTIGAGSGIAVKTAVVEQPASV
jgi:hypothetical protein